LIFRAFCGQFFKTAFCYLKKLSLAILPAIIFLRFWFIFLISFIWCAIIFVGPVVAGAVLYRLSGVTSFFKTVPEALVAGLGVAVAAGLTAAVVAAGFPVALLAADFAEALPTVDFAVAVVAAVVFLPQRLLVAGQMKN
jgi:hypothetical protein